MRKLTKKTAIFLIVLIVILVLFIFSNYGATAYEFIPKDEILANLHQELASNFTSSAISECEYHEIVNYELSFPLSLVDADLVEGHKILEGGEYRPVECKPKYSVAVIVPYRDRAEELRGFLVYMHTFLRHQKLHYRIFVVEQLDTHQFNRAKLMNIGALAAMKLGYPCLVLHDVDLLPLKPANIYACTKLPRHMSSTINKFRFLLPYNNLFGGAVALTSRQYKSVNGMSNIYFGWGGEDDDLRIRLSSAGLNVVRFEPGLSIYHMGVHKPQKQGTKKNLHLQQASARMPTDGLNSVKFTELATIQHPLFTHIMVEL